MFALEAAITLYGVYRTPSYGDEANYHFPLAKNITWQMIVDGDSDYSSAYTPLPFVIGHVVYRVFPSLYALRLLNWLVVLSSIIVFYRLARMHSKDGAIELTLLYSLNPYLLRASFLYLMFGYGLVFTLLGLYFYFKGGKAKHYILAHLCWGLAVLSMQWMLVPFVAVGLFELGEYFAERKQILTKGSSLALRVGAKLTVLLPAFLVFYQWEGLTHPNFHTHTLHASFEHVNGVLSVLGFCFFLYVTYYCRRLSFNVLSYLIFTLPVLFLGLPQHAEGHGINNMTGVVSAFSRKLETILHLPYIVTTGLWVTAGLLFLHILLKENRNAIEKVSQYMVLGLMAAFAISTRLGASHVFILLPFTLLAVGKSLAKKNIRYAMSIQWLVMTLAYVVYIIFWQSTGEFFVSYY